MKKTILLFVLILSLSCRTDDKSDNNTAIESTSLMPLKNGNSWTYTSTDSQGTSEYTIVCKEESLYENKTFYRITVDGSKTYPWIDYGFLNNKDSKTVLRGIPKVLDNENTQPAITGTEIYFYKTDLSEEMFLENSFNKHFAYGNPVTIDGKICYKNEILSKSGTFKTTIYFSKGIGKVKEEHYSKRNGNFVISATTTLKSYVLK